MMDNKNMPAFPVEMTVKDDLTQEGAQTGNGRGFAVGVTKLEYFACNAPCEIPGFFTHEPPLKNITPQPRWEGLPKEHQEYIKMWFNGDSELPDELKWFGEQYKKHEMEDRAYRHADSAARYFQWRRFYAEQLLKTLE